MADDPVAAGQLIDLTYRYFEANIPVDYWDREMDEFIGPKILKKRYEEITADIDKTYEDGLRYCFAGSHGNGKSMCCTNVLKRVVETGKFSALYVNLTDIVSVLLSPQANKPAARKFLLETDFLVVDEVDPRFMGSDNAADLFGRLLEPVIRTRIQNRLPLMMCTNSPNMTGSFSGPLQASLESLMKVVKLTSVPGKDVRGEVR
jgi:DNA replication protein DnaC